MRIVIDELNGRYHWRVQQEMPGGTDVCAHGCAQYPDQPACYEAVHRLAEPAIAARVAQQDNGHWGWAVCDSDGRPLAESGPVFHDAATCGRALIEIRKFAATVA